MPIRPRAVRALVDVRERLRDAAAASHAAASTAREATQLALVEEETQLERHVDDAAQVLGGARTVYDLDRYAESTGVYRFAIADAAALVDEATAATQITANTLRDSTRKLRSAEKIAETVKTTRDRLEASAEQLANDDMACSRRAR